MISTYKKSLLKRIQELEAKIKEQKEVCSQYHLACIYFSFDLEATRRERDEAREEVELLRESLLDEFEEDDKNLGGT